MNNKETTNRIYYLDIIRVIACLSVIMIHSSSGYVIKDFGSFNFWLGNIFDGLSRMGVPFFVMLSGALLLDENYNYSNKKIIKRITKMIIFFIFWSATYCIIYQVLHPIIKHESLNIIDIVKQFFKGHDYLWFIYMIVGLYLILPLLRLWVKKENKKYVKYFIILSIIFSFCIPQIMDIGSIYSDLFKEVNETIEKANLKYLGGYTTYFILGWYIHNYDVRQKKIIYILGVCSIIVTILGTSFLSISTGKAIQMYGELTVNVFFQTLMIFLIVKSKFNKKEIVKKEFIYLISKNTLGIYAIHPISISLIHKILLKFNINSALINIPVAFILAFISSFFVTYTFRKIPLLKKLLE